jgi:mannose-6-phosphate isomerase-like protein (cupin superfamily)
MQVGVLMNVENSEALVLIPNGFPVWIDVAQASIEGAGTAMRFVLPVHAHNLPLMHRQETKLVVALKGELDIRAGRHRIALLQEGEAIKLKPGVAHRIHQYGAAPSTVGAVLWPGAVEQAFRELAAAATQGAYKRSDMMEILGRYHVAWATQSNEHDPQSVAVRPFRDWLGDLPEALTKQLEMKWGA